MTAAVHFTSVSVTVIYSFRCLKHPNLGKLVTHKVDTFVGVLLDADDLAELLRFYDRLEAVGSLRARHLSKTRVSYYPESLKISGSISKKALLRSKNSYRRHA